jgi:hypothetical protein
VCFKVLNSKNVAGMPSASPEVEREVTSTVNAFMWGETNISAGSKSEIFCPASRKPIK